MSRRAHQVTASRALASAVAGVALVVAAACGSAATSSTAPPSLDGTTAAPAGGTSAVTAARSPVDPAVVAMAAAFREVFTGPRGDEVVARVESLAVAEPASGPGSNAVPADLVAMVRFAHEHADELAGAVDGSASGGDLAALLRQQPWYQRLSAAGRSAKQDPAAVVERYRRLAVLGAWKPKVQPGPDAVAVDVQATLDRTRADASVARLRSGLEDGLPPSFDAASVAGLDDLGVGLVSDAGGPAAPVGSAGRVDSVGVSPDAAGGAGVVAVRQGVTGPWPVAQCVAPGHDFVTGVVALAAAEVALLDLVTTPSSSPSPSNAAVVQLYLTAFSGPVGSAWAGWDTAASRTSCGATSASR